MSLKFAPRGASKGIHKYLPSRLQLYLFELIDALIVEGAELSDWQLFKLHQIEPGKVSPLARVP